MPKNTLAANMETFVYVAKLPKHETALWVPENSDNVKYTAFRSIEES